MNSSYSKKFRNASNNNKNSPSFWKTELNIWSAKLLAIHLHLALNEQHIHIISISKPRLVKEKLYSVYVVQIDVFFSSCNQTAVAFQLSSGNPVYENYYRQVNIKFPSKRV